MTQSDESARELVERATAGDPRAVDSLLEGYLPGLRAYVRRNVGQVVQAKESSSDLVQSVCREVLEHLDRFQYDGEDGFRKWLYATASRKIKDRHRYYLADKRNAARELPLGGKNTESTEPPLGQSLAESLASPSQDAVRREEIERIEKVFETLPENYRKVVQMAYVQRLPHREIAEKLDINEAHARVLLSRALARLGKLLKANNPEQET